MSGTIDGTALLMYTVFNTDIVFEVLMNIAVVTGAGSGVGREFALALAKEGGIDCMWLIGRREDRLLSVAEKLRPLPCRALSLDLTLPEDVERYRQLLSDESPTVSVLVNAAGFGKLGHHTAVDVATGMNMTDLNCKALVAVTELSLPYMKKGSVIYEIGSLSAFQPVPYMAVYAATKAFVLSYTRSLNRELKRDGIRAMAVCPGWMQTEFFDRAATSDTDAVTYFNRIYKAEDVVATALRHMKKGRDVSVHGLSIRLQVLAVKLLPHRLVMSVWMRQQKHK